MIKLHLSILAILCSCFCQAQKSVKALITDEKIIIDGELSEDIWSKLTPADDFHQYFPNDSLKATNDTEMYFAYDDVNLYIGIKVYGVGNKWLVNSLKRDYRAGGNDNITIVLDTYYDGLNAFFFGVNPEGVIREGTITNGGNERRDFDESWDNKWIGDAKKFDGYYTAELEIPFSILRFNDSVESWGLGSYRFDTQTNENHTWTDVPINQPLFNLAFNGKLIFEEPLRSKGRSMSLIPYVTSGFSKDHEAGTDVMPKYDIGGDAKIGITSGLNLDLTVNPDFSQVEVDRQVTNLDRFEIFFPERRQFFLENADLFGGFGSGSINPFFSRRIGTAENNDGDFVQNRILAGARLSGKLNDKLRVGLLNMQTANGDNGVFATNYTVAAVQRNFLQRSNISFIGINKQVTGDDRVGVDEPKYNRLLGVDLNMATNSNSVYGKTFLHKSFSPDGAGSQIAHGLQVEVSERNYGMRWNHEYVGDGYDAEVGFVRRKGYYNVNPAMWRTMYPQNGPFNSLNLGVFSDFIWNKDFDKTDHTVGVYFGGNFRNSARFEIEAVQDYVFLTNEFDPTGTDSEPLPANTGYSYFNIGGDYSSDRRKAFSFFINPYLGQYFNGFRAGTRGRITYRYEPRGSVSIDFNYNYFDMPYLEDTKQTFLLGPRVDYTFSKKIFLTTFIQYNTQSEQTNINARLQYRFAPASDFFIVYTDNYFTGADPSDRFTTTLLNRALVAKFTYWFNV